MSTTTTNGHPVETGCYVEGHRGWHGHAHMVSVAQDLGFELDHEGQTIMDRYDSSQHGADDPDGFNSLVDVVFDIMDEAEAWLNDHTSDGYAWGWHEGEFFLWSHADWSDSE